MWLLLACGERVSLEDRERELGQVELGGRQLVWSATLRAWRHGLSLDPSAPQLPYDGVYVGWEVTTERWPLQGDVSQTWDLATVPEGVRRFEALALERCETSGLLAHRVLEGEPWRLLVPDPAGIAGGRVPLEEAGTCEEALAWAGTAEAWRRDRAADPAVCTHLYRARRLDEAVRCLMREPTRGGSTGRASRQELPRAPGDPAFDGALLAALDPAAAGDRSTLSARRVVELLAEVEDQEQVRSLARRTERLQSKLDWQAALVEAFGR
jgi:hypothetical protein